SEQERTRSGPPATGGPLRRFRGLPGCGPHQRADLGRGSLDADGCLLRIPLC
ncbi:MAG: hypothetical protein JWM67_1785, partial [Mycobacterium sp.]|nr:hypothetical protein [Mycobacterium sp.]